jgi:hypothetical protein
VKCDRSRLGYHQSVTITAAKVQAKEEGGQVRYSSLVRSHEKKIKRKVANGQWHLRRTCEINQKREHNGETTD